MISPIRFYMLCITSVLMWIILITRLFVLQLCTDSIKSIHQPIVIKSERGAITDRYNYVLAQNIMVYDLCIHPQKMLLKNISDQEWQQVFLTLNQIIPTLTAEKWIQARYSSKKFIWLVKGVTEEQRHDLLLRGLCGNDEAIGLPPRFMRFYPQSHLYAHIVGYTVYNNNNEETPEISESKGGDRFLMKGVSGIEALANDRLNQGYNQKTTLDTRIQLILYETLQKLVTQYNAKGGNGIIVNGHGEIIASVSLFDFDPNNLPADSSDMTLYNKNFDGLYEFGSIFKIFTLSHFLNHGYDLDFTVDVQTKMVIGSNQIDKGRFYRKKHMTILEGFCISSNIMMARLSLIIGEDAQKDMFALLGFQNGISVDGKKIPMPQWSKKWGKLRTAVYSYGYGCALTPLHIIQGVQRVLYVNPMPIHVLYNENLQKNNLKLSTVGEKVLHVMHQNFLLRFATHTFISDRIVGIKTGTANLIDKNTGSYTDYKNRASVLVVVDGYYVILLTLDQPQNTKKEHNIAQFTTIYGVGPIVECLQPVNYVLPVNFSFPYKTLQQLDKIKPKVVLDTVADLSADTTMHESKQWEQFLVDLKYNTKNGDE